MPRSQQPDSGIEVIKSRIIVNRQNRVLDVGCGDGKWGKVLKGLVSVLDGVEVWGPNIVQNSLNRLYDSIYQCEA